MFYSKSVFGIFFLGCGERKGWEEGRGGKFDVFFFQNFSFVGRIGLYKCKGILSSNSLSSKLYSSPLYPDEGMPWPSLYFVSFPLIQIAYLFLPSEFIHIITWEGHSGKLWKKYMFEDESFITMGNNLAHFTKININSFLFP